MLNEERKDRMQRAMEAAGLDALVVRLPENVLLLSGHWPMIGAAFLILPAAGRATCILPACYEQEAAATLQDTDATYFRLGGVHDPACMPVIGKLLQQHMPPACRRVGYEGNFEAVAPSWNAAEALVPAADTAALLQQSFPGVELVDATHLLMQERLRKTPYEVERLAIASEISCFGLTAFQDAVEVGCSGVALAAAVEQAVMVQGTGYRGSVRVRAFAQVTTGPAETSEAHRPNVISTVRKLEDGDFAVLELGLVVDGYWADRTRVRIAGTARDTHIAIFETVRKAQAAGVAAAKAGVRAHDVDAAARSVIEDAGYGPYFPHITGHGLGFGYHESAPILGPHSEDTLLTGMMTSVEPGIYTREFGGCRLEDDIIVTDGDAKVLGPFKMHWQ